MLRQQSAIRRRTKQVGGWLSDVERLPGRLVPYHKPSGNRHACVLQMCCACCTMQLHITQRQDALAWLPSSSG